MSGHSKRPSATKAGPGRYYHQGAKKNSPLRKRVRAGRFGLGIEAQFARKRAEAWERKIRKFDTAQTLADAG